MKKHSSICPRRKCVKTERSEYSNAYLYRGSIQGKYTCSKEFELEVKYYGSKSVVDYQGRRSMLDGA